MVVFIWRFFKQYKYYDIQSEKMNANSVYINFIDEPREPWRAHWAQAQLTLAQVHVRRPKHETIT